MGSANTYECRRNDALVTPDGWTATLDATEPFDLTGATVSLFAGRSSRDKSPIIDRYTGSALVVTSTGTGAAGDPVILSVQYTLQPGDTTLPGLFRVYLNINSSGFNKTFFVGWLDIKNAP